MMHLDLPPLHQRGLDVLYLSQYFLAKLALESNSANKALSDNVNQWLLSYHFPGNVRELENIISRSFLLSTTDIIQFDDLHLPNTIQQQFSEAQTHVVGGFSEARAKVIEEFEKKLLTSTDG